MSYLCPFNEFCTGEAWFHCYGSTLISCEHCNTAGAVAFITIMMILGLAIVLGNSMIVWISIKRYRNKSFQKIDAIKLSLAVVDFLTGIQIFAFLFPNFLSVMNNLRWKYRFVCSYFEGFSLTFTVASSILHLILLGVQRLYAIGWPFRYKNQPIKHVYWSIAFVHCISAGFSATPLWIHPGGYCQTSFVCFTCGGKGFALFYSIIAVFVFMTFLSIATGILACVKLMRSRRLLNNASAEARNTKQQIALFKTVVIMQLGFTASLAPAFVIMCMEHKFICPARHFAYVISISGALTNSLWNVLIYSARDEKFRASMVEIFTSLKHKLSKCFCNCCRDKREEPIVLELIEGSSQNIEVAHANAGFNDN